jgi:integrase
MASVHKKTGSPYWYAFYRNADGRRSSKPTGLLISATARGVAQKVADEIERLAVRARQGTLTAERARECVSEIYQIAAGVPLLFHSVESWLKDWLENKAGAKSKATFNTYRVAVSGFLAHLGARARIAIELLTPRDFTGYRDALVKNKKSPQTANSYVKMLRIPFNMARKHGLIASNPAEAVEALTSDAVERITFTAEQVSQLVATATATGKNEWAGAILFGFYTGQRLSDIANLRWENIDLAATFPNLRLRQRKTKADVVVPLAPPLATWLLELPSQDDPKAFIFPELAGKATGGDSGLSAKFSALMGKAGFAADLARGTAGGRKLAALSFHCLRHTFNSIMANEGVASDIRQKLTGHASAEVHRRYTHHELGTLRKAIDVLPALGTAKPAKKRGGVRN